MAYNCIFIRAIRAVPVTVTCPDTRYATTIVTGNLLFLTGFSVRAVCFIRAICAVAVTVASVGSLDTKTVAAQKLLFSTSLGSHAVRFIRAIPAVPISVTSPLLRDALVGRDALELVQRARTSATHYTPQSVGLGVLDDCHENDSWAQEPYRSGAARAAHVASKHVQDFSEVDSQAV